MQKAALRTNSLREITDRKATIGCGELDVQELRHQLVELQTHMSSYTQRVVRIVAVLDIEEPDGSRTRLLATAGANMTPGVVSAMLVSGLNVAGCAPEPHG